MGLESPEDVFSIDFFRKDPKPFYGLAKVRVMALERTVDGLGNHAWEVQTD